MIETPGTYLKKSIAAKCVVKQGEMLKNKTQTVSINTRSYYKIPVVLMTHLYTYIYIYE
jgi:hypothetical protein